MYQLLSVSSDAKTIKGELSGHLTGILYLQPHTLSGKNLCPGSSKGCRATCLYESGRSIAFPSIFKSRARKAKLFLEERESFGLQLLGDVSKLSVAAKNRNLKAAVRLNGVTDVDFSKIKILGKTVMEHFPKIQFYDYTKKANRIFENKYKNYHLTFSLSEENEEIAKTVLSAGHNVAVVFDQLPNTFWGKPVINGDLNDLRFLDKKGVIVGLKAKGLARKDTTGFVRRIKNEIK